jgi:hypothetical protein
MSGYILLESVTGSAYHAVVERDSDGFYAVQGTQTWEAFDATHWGTYALNLPELAGSSRIYRAAFPSWIGAGLYNVSIRQGTAAGATVAAVPIASELWDWSGTARVSGGVSGLILTIPAAEIAAVLTGQDLTLHRGDDIPITISDLPALTGASKVWFTLKGRLADPDSSALVQIDLTGLLRLNGVAGTLGNGSVTIDTATAPAQVTIRLAAAASAALVPAAGLYWDLQMLSGGAVTTLTEGRARVAGDVTEAVS